MTTVHIGGLPLQDLTQAETLEAIERIIAQRRPGRMVVTNASKTVLAQQDPELKRIICESAIVTADGMSVVWASKWLGEPLRERVTGIDTMERLVELSARKGYRVYFLGAKPEVLDTMLAKYRQAYPDLTIAGSHHGYFADRLEAMLDEIKAARPDILFVAMGSPAQERWIARHQDALGVPFCMGVGGSFDHIAGLSKRAPVWMQKLGFEWLYRLGSEPGRLWKRYLVGNSKFIQLVIAQRIQGSPE